LTPSHFNLHPTHFNPAFQTQKIDSQEQPKSTQNQSRSRSLAVGVGEVRVGADLGEVPVGLLDDVLVDGVAVRGAEVTDAVVPSLSLRLFSCCPISLSLRLFWLTASPSEEPRFSQLPIRKNRPLLGETETTRSDGHWAPAQTTTSWFPSEARRCLSSNRTQREEEERGGQEREITNFFNNIWVC
jgi:hypothetical protein